MAHLGLRIATPNRTTAKYVTSLSHLEASSPRLRRVHAVRTRCRNPLPDPYPENLPPDPHSTRPPSSPGPAWVQMLSNCTLRPICTRPDAMGGMQLLDPNFAVS